MKWIKKCPVLFLLIVSGSILTIAGIAGKNSIYKEYDYNFISTPLLALTMEGLDRGVYPFGLMNASNDAETLSDQLNLADGEKDSYSGQSIEMFESAEDGSTVNGEGSAVPDNTSKEAPIQKESGKTYSFETVSEDYFKDAVFIGDSRTVGLFEYSGLADYADFFAKISLTIYDVFTDPFIKDEETGKKITLKEALQQKQYGKVYLMLGINELGTGTAESFMKEYEKALVRLKELQPDAVIFVEGIMCVTETKNESDPIFNNANIRVRNAEIEKLADQKDVFYIDVNEVVCDSQGNLNTEYTVDDIHLKAQYYEIWKQFLLEHGIMRNGR